ncbi:MAG TPA: Holliday junction resolvase RuvX [Candidatus Saccharimonadales bacterium]
MPPIRENIHILALDIGAKRVGVAVARADVRMPSPLVTLTLDDTFLDKLNVLIAELNVQTIVSGLPRGLDSQDTDQTVVVKELAKAIEEQTGLEIVFQDEALTSVKAKEELSARGKIYSKPDVDKLAACYILEDYIKDNF